MEVKTNVRVKKVFLKVVKNNVQVYFTTRKYNFLIEQWTAIDKLNMKLKKKSIS